MKIYESNGKKTRWLLRTRGLYTTASHRVPCPTLTLPEEQCRPGLYPPYKAGQFWIHQGTTFQLRQPPGTSTPAHEVLREKWVGCGRYRILTYPASRTNPHRNWLLIHLVNDRLLRRRAQTVPPPLTPVRTPTRHCTRDHPRHTGRTAPPPHTFDARTKGPPPTRASPPFIYGWLLATGHNPLADDYFGIGGTHEGGGSIVITQENEQWRSRPILVIPFHTSRLPADLGGLPSIMELLAVTGGIEVLATLGLTGTIYSDCQGLIRKLHHPHVLRCNTTAPGYPLLRYCVTTLQHPIQLRRLRSHPERSNAPQLLGSTLIGSEAPTLQNTTPTSPPYTVSHRSPTKQ